MKNKLVFIIPHFGKMNNYFNLFLKSCEFNKDIADWIIFTDDKRKYDYPENVIVNYVSFEKIKKRIQSKFDFKISLEHPYKLCDYRPAYGYIFEEEIKSYEYWGYCDSDLIFGKISNFITNDILNEAYDKLFIYGHCTLYKNNNFIRNAFMLKYKNEFRYKKVFQSYKNCSFDEEFNSSINNIFNNNELKIYNEQFQANIYTKYTYFKLTYWDFKKQKYLNENYSNKLFVWDKGRVIMYYNSEDGELLDKEFMYIHLQSRYMENLLKNENDIISFKIIPNKFENLEVNKITKDNYIFIKKEYFNLHYIRLRITNLKIKIKRRFIKKC